MSEDKCVCCGGSIPEGSQVCEACIKESEKGAFYVTENYRFGEG